MGRASKVIDAVDRFTDLVWKRVDRILGWRNELLVRLTMVGFLVVAVAAMLGLAGVAALALIEAI